MRTKPRYEERLRTVLRTANSASNPVGVPQTSAGFLFFGLLGAHNIGDEARRTLRRPQRVELPFGLFHFPLKLSVLRRPRRASVARFAPGFDRMKKGYPFFGVAHCCFTRLLSCGPLINSTNEKRSLSPAL